MNIRTLLFLPLLSLCCSTLLAQGSINERTDIREYSDELGYYQKANRDLNDPRFMFHDDGRSIDFGIGGKAQMESFYNFYGGLSSYGFKPAFISIPNEPSNCFGTDVSGSEIHIKSRAYWNGHKVIGYLRMGGGSDYDVAIKQVYVSIDGFSFGMIPSFLTDLEAGVKMYQAISTQADVTQPLMGYTFRSSKGLELAMAFEKNAFNADMCGVNYIDMQYQKIPDITAHVKYRWNSGHIQVGALFRRLSYWQKDDNTLYNDQGQDGNEYGWALSLSGNIKPSERLLFSYSALAGKGCAKYLPYFSDLNLELGLANEMDGTYKVMKGVPLTCASLSGMYQWNEKLSSSVIGGYAKCHKSDQLNNLDPTKSMTFIAANLICEISDFAYWGIEYFHGRKSLYEEVIPNSLQLKPSTSDKQNGRANRVAVLIGYVF